jgi:hypothetical protein
MLLSLLGPIAGILGAHMAHVLFPFIPQIVAQNVHFIH